MKELAGWRRWRKTVPRSSCFNVRSHLPKVPHKRFANTWHRRHGLSNTEGERESTGQAVLIKGIAAITQRIKFLEYVFQ